MENTLNKPKRGRPPKSAQTTLPIVGKQFEPSTSYVIGQLIKSSENAPRYPEFRPNGQKRKFYGSDMIHEGIETTAQFFESNPLGLSARHANEFWYIYTTNEEGTEEYFDKGQFKVVAPRIDAPKDNTSTLPFMPASSSLSDQLQAQFLNAALNGSQGKEMTSLYIHKLTEDLAYARNQIQEKERENSELREKNKALEIQVSQFEVTKQAEIQVACAQARREQEQEDEETFRRMLEEEKQQSKGGLSGLFDDPTKISALLQDAPKIIAAVKEMWSSIKPADQQPAQQQQLPEYQFGPNGEQLQQTPQY